MDQKIDIPNEAYDFSNITLSTPISVYGGAYFTKISNNGNDIYRNSKIGIGISAPDFPLHVAGEARIDGNVGIGGNPISGKKLHVNGETVIGGDITVTGGTSIIGGVGIGGSTTIGPGSGGTPSTLTIADLGDPAAGNQMVIVNSSGELQTNAIPTSYTLPTATGSQLGGIKVGDGLSIDAATGLLSNSAAGLWTETDVNNDGNKEIKRMSNVGINTDPSENYSLQVSGGIKVSGSGGNLTVQEDAEILGDLDVTGPTTVLNDVTISGFGNTLVLSDLSGAGNKIAMINNLGELYSQNPTASASNLGMVKVGSGLQIDASGVLSSSSSSPWSSNNYGIYPTSTSHNIGIGTTPSSTERLKISGNTIIENGSNHVKLYLTPGSSNKSSEIWMGHSGLTVSGLIKYQNSDGSMHFWANNTPILELTDQKVKIPATKTLENSGYLIVENTSTFNDDVGINGGDLTINQSQNQGGDLTVQGITKLETLNDTTSGSYDMVVANSSGVLHKITMSGMGSHWSSDYSGNPYVENKNVGNIIERIEQYLGVKEDIQAKYDERKGWILEDVERKRNGEPEKVNPKTD